jgi:hypothetical protein
MYGATSGRLQAFEDASNGSPVQTPLDELLPTIALTTAPLPAGMCCIMVLLTSVPLTQRTPQRTQRTHQHTH